MHVLSCCHQTQPKQIAYMDHYNTSIIYLNLFSIVSKKRTRKWVRKQFKGKNTKNILILWYYKLKQMILLPPPQKRFIYIAKTRNKCQVKTFSLKKIITFSYFRMSKMHNFMHDLTQIMKNFWKDYAFSSPNWLYIFFDIKQGEGHNYFYLCF